MDQQLADIARLVKSKAYDQARQPLQNYLRQHPDQPYAWYLLSYAAASRDKRLAAIRRAVELAPQNRQAQDRLIALLAQPRPRRRWPLLAAAGLVMIGMLLAALLFSQQGADPADEITMPTLAALSAETAVEDATAEVIAAAPTNTPTETQPPTASPLPSDTPTVQPSDTPAADVTATDRPADEPSPTIQTQTAQAQSAIAQGQSGGVSLPTFTATFAPPPTAQPTNSPAPTSTPLPPGPQPTAIPGAAPLNAPLNIGGGEMRVIEATRPGSALIAELGGSAPPPPSGQVWVLVELLLICGAENCAPDAGALRLLGDSGGVYPPGAGFNLEPVFGPDAYELGQVWGYAGFLVPSSEGALHLALSYRGTDYYFALQ